MTKVDGVEIDYSGLPFQHRTTVQLYIEHGYEPGSGWLAILRGDLRAVVACDAKTVAELPQIYRWLVNYAPSEAWGSRERVRAWMEAKRMGAAW